MKVESAKLSNLNLDKVLNSVYAHSTSMKSHLHGESHWLRVTKVGLDLAKDSPDCDLAIIFLFGLLHDTHRLNDGRDPKHGERASYFVQRMNDKLFFLSVEQLKTLAFACHQHDKGMTSNQPTISICWDADRLNLWRVKIVPLPHLLSTKSAKTWSTRLRALSIQFQNFTWHQLLHQYIELENQRI